VGPAPQGPFLKTCLNGKFSSLHRKLVREEQEGGVSGTPSYFTRRRDGIPVPALHKFMQGYKNLLKLNIPSKTIINSFLVMNRQIWTNQKGTLARPMHRNRLMHYVHYVARLRTPCTSCLIVLGALNLYGNWLERQSLP
jgi:hypothetical protein